MRSVVIIVAVEFEARTGLPTESDLERFRRVTSQGQRARRIRQSVDVAGGEQLIGRAGDVAWGGLDPYQGNSSRRHLASGNGGDVVAARHTVVGAVDLAVKRKI